MNKMANKLSLKVKEVFLEGKWIANTNYKQILLDVDLKTASFKVDSLNTIASLVYHINYYLVGLNEVFEGGELRISDRFSFDLPPLNSEDDWQSLKSSLLENAQIFNTHVERQSEEELQQAFILPQYGTVARNIEGVIEHAYYHLGQISMLKKLYHSSL